MTNLIKSDEIWKPVRTNQFENVYEVSSLGRVRSKDRQVKYSTGGVHLHKGKILSVCLFDGRYPGVILHKDGAKLSILTHRLVATEFIPNPDNKPFINHKDGNKENNSVDNLEWCTQSENTLHAIDTGLFVIPKGEKSHASKLDDDKVRKIRELYATGNYKQSQLCKMFNIGASQMCNVVNKKRYWQHVI